MKWNRYFLFAFLIVLIDQAVKLLVHYNMNMGPGGEIALVGDWFKLHYILNKGMAFGLSIGSGYGKLILTLFRIVAIAGIAYLLFSISKKKFHAGLLFAVAAILGGAIGNVIDSIFYGALLENAPYDSISPWFHGQVIDMFYFDVWEGYLPSWIPLWGGKEVALWPIFNVADAAIFIGIGALVLFQKRWLSQT